MKQKILLWQLMGFAVTSLGGTLLHFLYEWLGEAVWIAPFSGVNESTWEHMKLLFWPMLIFAVIESFFFEEREDFWCVKMRGILLGLILIPIIFYTYNIYSCKQTFIDYYLESPCKLLILLAFPVEIHANSHSMKHERWLSKHCRWCL